MIVYGIKNCNTMKKAFTWLDEHRITYQFVDYRNPGLSRETLEEILQLIDLDQLVNKRSTSWRALSDSDKEAVLNPTTAISILQAHPTLIKRPLIIDNGKAYVGFSEEAFSQQFL